MATGVAAQPERMSFTTEELNQQQIDITCIEDTEPKYLKPDTPETIIIKLAERTLTAAFAVRRTPGPYHVHTVQADSWEVKSHKQEAAFWRHVAGLTITPLGRIEQYLKHAIELLEELSKETEEAHHAR